MEAAGLGKDKRLMLRHCNKTHAVDSGAPNPVPNTTVELLCGPEEGTHAKYPPT